MTPSPRPVLVPFVVLFLLSPRPGAAADYNFAGSVSLNYKTLVNELSEPRAQRNLILSGFNINASIKAVVDVSPYLSATVKVCYGCHGFEAINMIAELTPHPAINIRAGRFQPAFGDFYLRHDPTSHKTADNPLPYDMGHMVHFREWAYGVLPVPYVDNGAEVFGTLRPKEWLSISYAAHVVGGWKSAEASATCPAFDAGVATALCTPVQDFALRRMRFLTANDYVVDNNRWPGMGGRLALTFARTTRMNPATPDITIGGSAMYGRHDDYDLFPYLIVGADLYIHLWRINLRAEVLRRQLDIDPRLLDYPGGGSTGLQNAGPDAARTVKDGFYAEADFPMGNFFEGVLRLDGMRRSGPRPARENADRAYRPPPAAVFDFEDWILRYTVGVNFIPLTGAKLKVSYEYWTFKDVSNDPFRSGYQFRFQDEHMLHLALVASF